MSFNDLSKRQNVLTPEEISAKQAMKSAFNQIYRDMQTHGMGFMKFNADGTISAISPSQVMNTSDEPEGRANDNNN
jgi:hypothetical protein